jgi:xanthine dehydrogenase molybdenum-binding subunit
MVVEVLGIPMNMVHVVALKDTDITPFDTGAAVKKAALEVREKVLKIANRKTGITIDELNIEDAKIIEKTLCRVICSLEDIAMEDFYNRVYAAPITSDISENVRINAPAYGVTFTEVEVDMKTGKVEVVEIYNVHDSGIIMNPKLAEGQVHGGVSMALGYALSEQLLFDKNTGKTLNNNLIEKKTTSI